MLSPAPRRADRRRWLALGAGLVLPLAVAAFVLAVRGGLADAVTATLVYPRHYAAEIATRTSLAAAVARGGMRLVRGAPLLLVCAAAATGMQPRRVWMALLTGLGLAAVGAVLQQQMAGYHLYALVPPLALLAGFGAARLAHAIASAWRALRRGDVTATLPLTGLGLLVALAAATEARLWAAHYAPHIAHARGDIDRDAFWMRLGGPGPRWIEAHAIAAAIRSDAGGSNAGRGDAGRVEPETDRDTAGAPTLLVWGLAPAIYALAGQLPATRFAFHQTFYVAGAPLAARFGRVDARRRDLLALFETRPPDWVVVVHGDASGLEPSDSAAELRAFPELAACLETRYWAQTRTASFALFRRRDAAAVRD
jgi:hypothetical protein